MKAVAVDLGYQADRRLFDRYIRLIPVLWLLGALMPAAAGLLIYLSKRHWPRGLLINSVVIGWCGIAGMQAVCSILNGLLLQDELNGLRYSVSIIVYGWIFGALAIGVGYSCRLANHHYIRAVSILGASIIVLTCISIFFYLSGTDQLIFETPVSLLFPNSHTVQEYSRVIFFELENNWDEQDVRLTLFYPWAVSLGLGGIAVTWISSLDRSLLFRFIGVSGGLIANICSQSRSAIAIMAVTIAVWLLFRLGGLARTVILLLCLLIFFGALVNGFEPFSMIQQTQDEVDEMRPGSSMIRNRIYEGSWKGFWESPIIGNGWPGDSVTEEPLKLPIGTHSSISGLLYTGGILTFGAFVIAMALTMVACLRSVLNTRYGSEGRRFAEVGVLLILSAILFCPFESLFADTLPSVFLFAWVGGAIREGMHYVKCPDFERYHTGLQQRSFHPGGDRIGFGANIPQFGSDRR
jgi:hypothetical protein